MCKYCHGKSSILQEQRSFRQHIGLTFNEETSKMLHLEHSCLCVVLKLRHCGRYLGSCEMWCWV